jgi:hypothetical protein
MCFEKQVMFLYLNQEVFEHDAEGLLTGMLKRVTASIDQGARIDIILLHELDPEQKGCKFDIFSIEPYNIYSRGIAVPLHRYEDYREIGLKRFLLCKLGASRKSIRRNVFQNVEISAQYYRSSSRLEW